MNETDVCFKEWYFIRILSWGKKFMREIIYAIEPLQKRKIMWKLFMQIMKKQVKIMWKLFMRIMKEYMGFIIGGSFNRARARKKEEKKFFKWKTMFFVKNLKSHRKFPNPILQQSEMVNVSESRHLFWQHRE